MLIEGKKQNKLSEPIRLVRSHNFPVLKFQFQERSSSDASGSSVRVSGLRRRVVCSVINLTAIVAAAAVAASTTALKNKK